MRQLKKENCFQLTDGYRFFLILLFTLFTLSNSSLIAQSVKGNHSAFTENTHDSTRFEMFVDSITTYIYVDNQKVKEYFQKCEHLIKNGLDISSKLKVKYIVYKVYDELGKENQLKSYELLKDNRHLLDNAGVTIKQKNQFKYLEGYTQMVLGDFEFAQNAYHELLKYGELHKDTVVTIQALYSLGQLFSIQKDFEKAEQYYLREYDIEVARNKRGPRSAQIILELINLYIESKQLEKASHYVEQGLEVVNEFNAKDLKVDMLRFKGEIAIENGDIATAQTAYNKAALMAYELENNTSLKYCKKLKAKIYNAKGQYPQALKIYEQLIENETTLLAKKDWYEYAQATAEKMQNYHKAYQFALEAASIGDSIQLENKIQQSQYLSMQFELEQKEKANQILEAAFLQEKTQKKYLYALAFIFMLCMVSFIGAFYQKKQYNSRLREEVNQRTLELQEANSMLQTTNKELDEFTRILSHDLKEPLRSIVGFSTLAKRKLDPDSAANEYLGIISNSGRQLNQLIQDVALFQKAGDLSQTPPEYIDANQIIDSIARSIQLLLEKKNVKK